MIPKIPEKSENSVLTKVTTLFYIVLVRQQKAINKALKISSNLNELWVSGDLTQKKKLQNLVFPSGIGYNKLNGEVRTKKVNSIFYSIPMISEGLAQIKNGESINFDQFSAKVNLQGFEPRTSASVVRCSIQLSYRSALGRQI